MNDEKNNEKLSLNKAQETDYLNFINILERTLLVLIEDILCIYFNTFITLFYYDLSLRVVVKFH